MFLQTRHGIVSLTRLLGKIELTTGVSHPILWHRIRAFRNYVLRCSYGSTALKALLSREMILKHYGARGKDMMHSQEGHHARPDVNERTLEYETNS